MTTPRGLISSSFWDENGVRERSIPAFIQVEMHRRCRNRLKKLAEVHYPVKYAYTWGFVCYRTVYTPGSNDSFAAALWRIHSYVDHVIFSDTRLSGGGSAGLLDPKPNWELMHRFWNLYIDDPNILGDATIDKVGRLFANWVDLQVGVQVDARPCHIAARNPRFRMCLLVDKEVIDNILRLPGDPLRASSAIDQNLLKVVVPNRGGGPARCHPISITELPELWFTILDVPVPNAGHVPASQG